MHSISIDPIDQNGYHFGFTADYLTNRVCEPDLSQRFNGERFHPNAYYALAVSEATGELWMEVWTTRILYRGEEVTIDYNYANRTTSYETPITQAKYMQSDAFQAAQLISILYKKMGLELREDGGMNDPVTGFSIGTQARKSGVGKTKPRIPAYPLEFQHAERWSETLDYNMTYTMTYNMTYTRSLELFGPVFFSYMHGDLYCISGLRILLVG